MPMTDYLPGSIRDLRNLGPHSAKMLAKAGIVSQEQLKAMGAVAAFVAVKRAGYQPNRITVRSSPSISTEDIRCFRRATRRCISMRDSIFLTINAPDGGYPNRVAP